MVKLYLPKAEEGIQMFVVAAIVTLCKRRGRKIEKLAEFLNKDMDDVYSWIRGDVPITIPELFKAGQFLSVRIDWFFSEYYKAETYPQNGQYSTEGSNHRPGLLEIAGLTVIRDTNGDFDEPIDITRTDIRDRERDAE